MVEALDKKAITDAIRAAEAGTSGEIRVHVKRGKSADPLKDAKKLFLALGMHKTAARNGVLIFVSRQSHTFAIVGDEGIDRVSGASFWDSARDRMQERFAKGELNEGIKAGVKSVGAELKMYFPVSKTDKNELSDDPTEHP
jgi:uncharacterized membrane protein